MAVSCAARVVHDIRFSFASLMYNAGMARWCTVSVTDAKGARHSIDVRAESTFDTAHLYVTTAKSQQAMTLPSRNPVPTVATVFEVVAEGKIFQVHGTVLQRWIAKRRGELGGPKGLLFRERPGID